MLLDFQQPEHARSFVNDNNTLWLVKHMIFG